MLHFILRVLLQVSWALELLTGGLADPRDLLPVEHTEARAAWEQAARYIERGDVVAASTHDDDDFVKKGFRYEGGVFGKAGEGVLKCGLVSCVAPHMCDTHTVCSLRSLSPTAVRS